MIDLKTIVVPVDFSAHSETAFQMALELARRFRSELYLLHVHQLPAYVYPDGIFPLTPEIMAEIEQKIAIELGRLAERVRAAEVRCVQKSVLGVTFVEIVRFARETEADLIVMGTHGRSGLSHALLGSVTEKVLRKAPCPVLAVRPESHTFVHP